MDNLALLGNVYTIAKTQYRKKADQSVETETMPSQVGITKSMYHGQGETTEIPLSKIVDYAKTEVKFKMTVFTYMAHSVGQGFYNTADMTTPTGRKAKELIDDFTNVQFDLDTINQKFDRDLWASGNGFLHVAGDQEMPVQGIYMLPLSAFTAIRRDYAGNPVEFTYNWGQVRNRKLPANLIKSLAWLPWDEEAFGEGIGQVMARKGLGYTTEAGTFVKRPSLFEAQEKIDDIVVKMLYAGVPRWAAMLDPDKGGSEDVVDDITTGLNKMDPLQHLVINAMGDIKQIGLEPSNKFDSFLRHMDDQVITGTMSPLIRLWSSLDFTYASAEAALQAMNPLIGMNQRAYKRFVEMSIYKPFLEQVGISQSKADVRINWGTPQKLKMDELKQLTELLSNPMFSGKVDPESLLDGIAEAAGMEVKASTEEMRSDITSLRMMIKDAERGRAISVQYLPENMKKEDILALQKLSYSKK